MDKSAPPSPPGYKGGLIGGANSLLMANSAGLIAKEYR